MIIYILEYIYYNFTTLFILFLSIKKLHYLEIKHFVIQLK